MCAVCNKNFINIAGQCISNPNNILNCEIQQQINGTDLCRKCDSGYQLSNDFLRCILRDTTEKKCAAWTTQSCIKCYFGFDIQSSYRNVADNAHLAYFTASDYAGNASFYTNALDQIFTFEAF